MKKACIVIAVVLFIVAAAGQAYVRSDAFTGRVRALLIGPMKEALGEDAVIGKVKVNFVPLFIEVRDISLPSPRGTELAAVRKITAYINPLSLLKKELRLSYISVLEPRVYPTRARDGSMDLLRLLERIRANVDRMRRKGPSRFTVLLRTISMKSGRIVFTDDGTSSTVEVSGINAAARVDAAQVNIGFSVRNSQVRFATQTFGELSGKFTASAGYRGGVLRIDVAELSIADASLFVAGSAGPFPDAVLDLRADLKSGPRTLKKFTAFLKQARTEKEEPARLEASATIRGKASAPVVDGGIKVSALSYGGMTLRDIALSASYAGGLVSLRGEKWRLAKGDQSIVIDAIEAALAFGAEGIEIRQASAQTPDLLVGMEGTVSASKGIDAVVRAESSGKGRTLAFFTRVPFEGAIRAEGTVQGKTAAPRFEGNVTAGPVTVRGVLFHEVKGGVVYADKKITLTDVAIREQSSQYVLGGAVDFGGKEPVYTARLRVLKSSVVNIVALFYKQLPLKLQAEGELTFDGAARDYRGTGYLNLKSGSAYGESFTKGVVTAELSTGRIAFPKVVLYKEKGVVKATGWIQYSDRTYSADLEGRGVDLSDVDRLGGVPVRGDFTLDIHSEGSFSHPVVKASLLADGVSFRDAALGGLNAALEIRDGLLTATAGLSGDRAKALLRWRLKDAYPWTAEARLKSGEIEPLLFFGNREMSSRVKAVADGAITAQGRGLDGSSISGEAVFQRLSILIGDYRIDNESDARLTLAGGRIAASSLQFTGQGTRIGVTGWVKPAEELDVTVKGTANLSLLKLLYREVEYTEGAAEMKLTLKDDWSNPDIAGELLIRGGEVKVKDIPQRFSALNGKIVFSEGRIVADELSAEMGGGTLNVSGWARLNGVALREFSVRTVVGNVTVRYPAGLVSTLSGDLYYDGDAGEQSLSGDVTISRARYDRRIEWKTMLTEFGRGLYQKKKTAIGWIGDTRINVRFHGENNILFQNNLAVMSLNVDVLLRGTVNRPQLVGRIESRKGVVYFRKNEFKILHASTDFTDPNRMNPVLDIQAETQVREYRIRLAVTGTAERAVVTFLSEPSLSDTDILALLALGKKGSELKGKEAEKAIGIGEGVALASGRAQDFFERRARSLTGLDRFQVDPYITKGDVSVPRVTMGKELVQDKLYLTYSSNVGSPTPEQIFRIEYLLNRHFSVVGESNDLGNTGADIKYRFEFR